MTLKKVKKDSKIINFMSYTHEDIKFYAENNKLDYLFVQEVLCDLDLLSEKLILNNF